MENNKEFKILNIVLLESNFSRVEQISLEAEIVKDNIVKTDIKVIISGEEQSSQKRLAQVLTQVEYTLKYNEIEEIKAKIIYTGIFESQNISFEEFEKFAFINGAAMVYPYIREHLSGLFIKASLTPFFLPPQNFVKLYEERNLGDN